MIRVQIENRLKSDFCMTPRGLWRAPISGHAKAFAAYLFSLSDDGLPSVLEMEQAAGFGRDARRRAFAELEAFGFLRWRLVPDRLGRICAKTLVLEWSVFVHAPEIQAHGVSASDGVDFDHGPENQAGGKSTPTGVEFHPCRDTLSGDLKRERKKESAARARKAVRSSSASPSLACSDGVGGSAVCTGSVAPPRGSSDPVQMVNGLPVAALGWVVLSGLSRFQRSALVRPSGNVLVNGRYVCEGSSERLRLSKLLASQDA